MSDPAPSNAPQPVEWACVRLARDLKAVGPAVDALLNWLRRRGIPADAALDELELAVTEALTNSLRHGGGGAQDFATRFAWCWRNGELEIEVSEPGRFEPPPTWDKLPEDPLSESGRGGFLITELMSAVEHRNENGRHSLRMRRRLECRPDADLASTEAALEAMTEDLGNAYETIAALFGLAEDLATSGGLSAMAEKSLARLRPLTGSDAAWVRLASPGGTLRRLASDGATDSPAEIDIESAAMEAVVARAAVERTLELRSELDPADPLRAPSGCAFVCPFSFEGKLRGVLTVTRSSDGAGFFTAGQTALARTLADFLGIACANADLQTQRRERAQAQRELTIAANIQRALLPQAIVPHPAWSVRGVCAQAAEVGGDFFDVIDLPDGARLIVIADVMGKGVPAALMAATLRTATRTLAALGAGPGELLTRANHQLCADLGRLDMFITAQVLRLDADGGGACYASAGHCPILSLDRAGRPSWAEEAGGLPVGVSAEERYPEARLPSAAGTRFWLMTDGAIEREDGNGEQLGPENFGRLAAGLDGPDSLLEALLERSGDRVAGDDCTLVCVTCTKEISTP
jgi:serine phosphatase RsbU (regulator of sigma subunit)/anti-sigma regulatory factor (Ser/Thr protein kinase)